jgi:hypothetical protein
MNFKSLDRYFQVSILEAFDNICQRCGTQAVAVHHIIHRTNPTLRHDARNGVPLCPSCHAFAHSHPCDFNEWVSGWLTMVHGVSYEDLKRLGN